MNADSWPPEFEQTLRPYLTLLPADAPITPDLDLTGHGLDSVGSIALILELEDAFAIALPDDQLTPDTFATAGALWGIVYPLVVPS